jgi:hypothetical protein
LVAAGLSAQGYTGSWHANLMPRAQVETARAILAQAEKPAYLTPAAVNWPERSTWQYVDYVRFSPRFDQQLILDAKLQGSHFASDADYNKFLTEVGYRTDAPTYLIFTDQMSLYAWYFGVLPADALPNLKNRIRNDPRWENVFDGEGIAIFVHHVS